MQTPAGKLNEVLLEWVHAERVGHRIVCKNPIRPFGAHDKLAVACEERRRDAELPDGRLVKIAKDSLCIGVLHRQVVMRALPERRFGCMA